MKHIYKKFVPVMVVFVVVIFVTIIFRRFLEDHGFSAKLLLAGNVILFCLAFFGFLFQTKGLTSSNTNVFLRSIYASLLVKIFVVIIALALYLFIEKGKVNKPSIFCLMGLYILYTFIEVRQLLKISRRKPDA